MLILLVAIVLTIHRTTKDVFQRDLTEDYNEEDDKGEKTGCIPTGFDGGL